MKLSEAIQALERECHRDGKSLATLKTYRFHIATYARGLAAGTWTDPQGYVDHQTTTKRLSSKTVWQSLNALKFFYDRILRQELGRLQMPSKSARGGRRVPTCLSPDECFRLFSQMAGTTRLQAKIMYGSGLRVSELCKLRIKDLDFENRSIHIHSGKGDKDRRAPMPEALQTDLLDHLGKTRRTWEADQRTGTITPAPTGSLKTKLGAQIETAWEWMWVFPSTAVRQGTRWHATPQGINKAIRSAARRADIAKRVSAHTMRHSFATALIRSGTDIRTLQTLLGHSNLETTQIYLHSLPATRVTSPLDAPASNIITLPATQQNPHTRPQKHA